MAMATAMVAERERSKPLHNFSMPCLKWGNQRFLRCVKDSTMIDLKPRTLRTKAPHPHHTNQLQKKMEERAKFSVSLSKEQVEQDFWAFLGTRPPRRPKKRPRIVQKNLDTLFPGLWLTDVTAESYKVPE
uniref:DUF1639 family protein n=1 Tax=Glycine max TaxID=3847 RepID=C6TEI2_SOYBN|nr:unknown [Glycine max]